MDHTFKVNKNGPLYKWLAFYYSSIRYGACDDHRTYRQWVRDGFNKPSAVSYYEHYCTGRPYDFCMFWRHVLLWPLIRLAFNIAFFGVFATLMATLISMIAAYPGSLWIGGGVLLFVVLIIAAVFGVIVALHGASRVYNGAKKVALSNKFVAEMYNSHKNNICKNVEYTKSEN